MSNWRIYCIIPIQSLYASQRLDGVAMVQVEGEEQEVPLALSSDPIVRGVWAVEEVGPVEVEAVEEVEAAWTPGSSCERIKCKSVVRT